MHSLCNLRHLAALGNELRPGRGLWNIRGMVPALGRGQDTFVFSELHGHPARGAPVGSVRFLFGVWVVLNSQHRGLEHGWFPNFFKGTPCRLRWVSFCTGGDASEQQSHNGASCGSQHCSPVVGWPRDGDLGCKGRCGTDARQTCCCQGVC